jgi:hypothetical protein
MAQSIINGQGGGLPYPQALYPANPNPSNTPYTLSTNAVTLSPGSYFVFPAGKWTVQGGPYSVLQVLDPVTGIWRSIYSNLETPQQIQSDGFNYRVANLTGCVVGVQVTNAGSGYTQSTVTVTPSAGNSTYQAIVGGTIGAINVIAGGTNYTVAPTVIISAPPSPGVQATAYATLNTNVVSTITLVNQGAGYTTAPTVTIIPSPLDPNYSTITAATATAALTGTGKITAILVTNPGQALATAPTLTIAGGTSGAATPLWLQTTTAISATTGGTGSGTAMQITSIGGNTTATSAWNNPITELTGFIPRALQAFPTVSAGVLKTPITVVDGGLFVTTPTAIVNVTGGVISATAPVATPVLGSVTDTVYIQQG